MICSIFAYFKEKTMRWLLMLICAAAASHFFSSALHAQEFASQINMLTYGADGTLLTPSNQLEALIGSAKDRPPTDIYILAHGWNNSFSDALDSYETMASLLRDVAVQHRIVTPDYRSLVIGISWPSKAWDNDAGRSLSSQAESDIATLYRTWSPKQGGGTYEADIAEMEQLLSIPKEQLRQVHYARAGALFQKYAIRSSTQNKADDASAFQFDTGGRSLFGNVTIRDGLRLFTYWQMKERAGIIGETGIRQLVNRIQTELPLAKLHLFGHSFGAKLMLACVSQGSDPSRKIDTLGLLQGAVSYQAMKPGVGGYDNVPDRVRGPLIVTFSNQDEALGIPYELASRWAGQTAETGRAISQYAALGRVGSHQGRPVDLLNYEPLESNGPYGFVGGVYDINGSALITGHGEFKNKSVAELIWCAVRPASRGQGLIGVATGRDLNSSAAAGIAERARKVVSENQGSLQDAEIVKLYTDTIQSLVPNKQRHSPIESGLSPHWNLQSLSIDSMQLPGLERPLVRPLDLSETLQKAIVDERFLTVPSYSKNVRQWIIDGRSTPMIGRVLSGQGCSQLENSYQQCVAVGWRLKALPGAGWNWIGTGTLIRWNVVITAAHVVPAPLAVLSSDLRAQGLQRYELGISCGNQVNVSGNRVIPVKLRIEHPRFSTGPEWKDDIAILQLSDRVKPKDLNMSDDTGHLPINLGIKDVWNSARVKDVTLVGFGSCDEDADPGTAGKRRAADGVPIGIPTSAGDAATFGCRFGYEFVCGGKGVDTCPGDSGGPVFFIDEAAHKYYLVGITSRGSRVQLDFGLPRTSTRLPKSTKKCGQGGVYEWVGAYLDSFITPTIQSLSGVVD
jgi:Trypsin